MLFAKTFLFLYYAPSENNFDCNAVFICIIRHAPKLNATQTNGNNLKLNIADVF